MDEILEDFKAESKALVEQLLEILDEVEGQFDRRSELENFGQVVDRIMGGASTVQMALEEGSTNIEAITQYAKLCKIVGYKASQIENNEQFFDIVVALLQDATEMLEEIVDGLGGAQEVNLKEVLNETFLDRLNWISDHFDENIRASVATPQDQSASAQKGAPSQADIDALLKQLGVV